MRRISIELVPRSSESLQGDLELVKTGFPQIDTVNIPDLLRFELRSWEACRLVKNYYQRAIPHIRAIDLDLNSPLPFADCFAELGIEEVLVLTGDPPQDMTRMIYPTDSVALIKKFKQEFPQVKVYAALDQYRASMRVEYDYIKRKLDAGADGFFTQPFYDLRLLEIYAEMLEGLEVFWGVSPVTSSKSVTYWETKNHVIFPKEFEPSLEWNIKFARQALEFTEQIKAHIYFMPIRTNLQAFLAGLFGAQMN
ncbi:MAG: methylenetetrahydrofolate reductase [Firmicutes bacterium]|nr:methylenetetrahydrofolate reductase [Bacillota bacterium]